MKTLTQLICFRHKDQEFIQFMLDDIFNTISQYLNGSLGTLGSASCPAATENFSVVKYSAICCRTSCWCHHWLFL